MGFFVGGAPADLEEKEPTPKYERDEKGNIINPLYRPEIIAGLAAHALPVKEEE